MEIIFYTSPIGILKITATDKAVTGLSFTNKKGKSTKGNNISKQTIKELDEYFKGKRKKFSLSVAQEGTFFQKRVWKELTKIPYGKTISYNELAKRAGSPRAYRAAGSVNGKNPICIIVPCHRVIAASGKIGGYIGGEAKKSFLLKLEGLSS